MTTYAETLRAIHDARVARAQTIRGVYAWIAIDFPEPDAVGMTAAVLGWDAEEVAAAIEGEPVP